MQKNQFNQLRVTGTNTNGTLGIGTDDLQSTKVHQLYQFNNKRIYSMSVGDFHTLAVVAGCNCVDPIRSQCKG